MTDEQFVIQVQRLQIAFGEKPFDKMRLSMIRGRVGESYPAFCRIVDKFISARRPSDPPLPQDFADAYRLEEKNEFLRDVNGAIDAMNTPWQNGLQEFLAKEYPGCKTLNEAVQVQILKNQIRRAQE